MKYQALFSRNFQNVAKMYHHLKSSHTCKSKFIDIFKAEIRSFSSGFMIYLILWKKLSTIVSFSEDFPKFSSFIYRQ